MAISLTSPLLESAGFSHGFSTRAVDLQLGSGAYLVDLRRFMAEVGIDLRQLCQARQVHGTRTLDAATRAHDGEAVEGAEALEEADALVAWFPYAVGVRVADCVPILVADRATGAVAAIHAGWRGTAGGVIASAFAALRARGATGPFLAAVGPCIGGCCFEVASDVGRNLVEATSPAVVTRREGEKMWIDLRAAVRVLLDREGLGAASVDEVGGCTCCEKDLFFSYRRDGAASGRHLAVIAGSALSLRSSVRAPARSSG